MEDSNFLYAHSLAGDDAACPGCGLPLHRHSISEATMIEESILEEYVRLNRAEGGGVFAGTTNQREGRRRGENGGGDGEDGKAAKRLKGKLEQYTREVEEGREQDITREDRRTRRSLFLKGGEELRQNIRHISLGKDARRSLTGNEDDEGGEGGVEGGRRQRLGSISSR